MLESISTDLRNIVEKIGRQEFLQEWIENKNIIFSPENLNKIEALYGNRFLEALKNILYRMENGGHRPQGKDSDVNWFTNWINGSAGKKLISEFVGNLKRASTKAGVRNMSQNFFKKLALEFGEEEFELVMRDIVSGSMLMSHSPEFYDIEVQRQTLMGTLLLSGSMGSVGAKADYEAARDRVYAEFREKGYNAISDIDTDIEVTTK